MRIGILFKDMQEFGGLEEIAVSLAVEFQNHGHEVNVISTGWVPPNNQYLRRLRQNDIDFLQLPKWISYPASKWETKETIQKIVMRLLTPFVYLLSLVLITVKRRAWSEAHKSARGWLRGQLMKHIIGPDRRSFFTRFLLNWWKIKWQPDILHIHGYTNTLLFAVDWAHDNNIPVIYEEHQTPDSQFSWWEGFDKIINKSAVVVAVSEKSAEALREVCGVTRPIVVMGPVVPDPIAAGWKKAPRPHVKNTDSIRLTTVARLYVTKGLKYLLETIVKVRQTHPNTRFRVYGDGGMKNELMEYAQKLGLNGSEIFVGAFTDRQELSEIMADTDIFIMSSILEGQPLGIVEAMSYGCPIVATSVGGIPEIIEDGNNGLLCPSRDPDCLATKVRMLIEDKDLRMSLGEAARESYKNGPFQPNSVCEFFISLYKKVLREQHSDSVIRMNREEVPHS